MLAAVACIAAARGAPAPLPLDPAHAVLGFRSYKLGLFPADGTFGRFSGSFLYDPASLACRVDLTAEVSSLTMNDAALRETVLSPAMMDAGRYPSLSYHGGCEHGALVGDLTLHGQTRPFVLAITREGASLIAQGTLQRGKWGITGLPLLAGQSIRIRVTAQLSQ